MTVDNKALGWIAVAIATVALVVVLFMAFGGSSAAPGVHRDVTKQWCDDHGGAFDAVFGYENGQITGESCCEVP